MESTPKSPRTAFTTGEASRLTGVPHRTVDYWAKTGMVTPSIADTCGSGRTRYYDFGDLIALRAARELSKAGISKRSMTALVERLRTIGWSKPLTQARLLVIGSEVYLVRGCKELEATLRKQGQTAFAFMLDLEQTVRYVETEIRKVA